MSEIGDIKRRLKALELKMAEMQKGVGRPPLHVTRVREWLLDYLSKSKRPDKSIDPRYLYIATDREGFSRHLVRKAAKQLGWTFYDKYWRTQ